MVFKTGFTVHDIDYSLITHSIDLLLVVIGSVDFLVSSTVQNMISSSIFISLRVFLALRALRILRTIRYLINQICHLAVSFLENLEVIFVAVLKSIPALSSIIILITLFLCIL